MSENKDWTTASPQPATREPSLASRLGPSDECQAYEGLADRVEKLDGPDRETDVAIAVAVDWRWEDWEEGDRTAREMADKNGLDWLASRVAVGFNSIWRGIPRYTASLDAAMTLVPEGCRLRSFGEGKSDVWAADIVRRDDRRCIGIGSGATPSFALTAAALRAHATKARGQ